MTTHDDLFSARLASANERARSAGMLRPPTPIVPRGLKTVDDSPS